MAATEVPNDLTPEVPSQVISKQKRIEVGTLRHPSIITSLINTSQPQLTQLLQDAPVFGSGQEHVPQTHNWRIEEGPTDVSFDSDLGFPVGWTVV
ncbi:hypothetical protein T265_16336, partial [Opisthorchis viverrini]